MTRRVVSVLSLVIVIATPAVLVGNSAGLLMQPWFVDAQYAVGGIGDPTASDDSHRAALAKTGVRAIQPGGEGIGLLERARLPDDGPAFASHELRHMSDVRGLVGGLLAVWAAALGCAVLAAVGLRRIGAGSAVRDALRRGGRLTVVLMCLLGVSMAVAFEQVFTAFHSLTFEAGTWRFADEDTLRQLYPDAFWVVAGVALTVLVLMQAAAALVLARLPRLRALRSPRPPAPA